MQDMPKSSEIVEVVSEFMRQHVLPQLQGHTAFHALVAANALDIVKRELAIAPEANEAEKARLEKLLGREGTLEELNRLLCARIEAGDVTVETPGLADHLWETTLTKLAIDQPKYSGYRRAKGEI
ncbi:conserved protein [Tepidicaulis marinus]|uniref:Conserved protein n=1 Tax=Tepidicaulis marinus TaxID=1333998 RepID=A0A081B7D3_9HYPH|nr:DUF6285 domain-containing protein [Tepidicaulis marinus]GAK43951.1 conserved protein [Tepidicaulis marinus]